MAIKNIKCPLVDKMIGEYECYLIAEAAEGNIPQNEMPCKQSYETEKEICMKCKFHDVE